MNPGKLILACRSKERGETALKGVLIAASSIMLTVILEDIERSTGCKTMVVWPLDLSDFSSVKAFVDRYEKEGGGQLDVLLENAGIVTEKFKQTKDGWETT